MIAVRWRIRRHLRRVVPRLRALGERGCDNRNALAVIAAESFFRPAPLRLGEYLVWFLFSLVGSARVERLSLGLAQVQLRHWRTAGLLDGTRWSPARQRTVADAAAQYRAALAFLAAHGLADETDPRRLTRRYTGHDRRYYPELLAGALSALAAGASP